MKKNLIYIALSLLLIIILGAFIINWAINPMRKSEAEIREYLLQITPIGTSEEAVIEAIEENAQKYVNHRNYEKFKKYKHFDYGFAIKDGRAVLRYHGYKYDDSEMIGNKTIRAAVGKYTRLFGTTVFACWAFDENGKLVDIGVYKEIDGF